jgi:hypothetical protein
LVLNKGPFEWTLSAFSKRLIDAKDMPVLWTLVDNPFNRYFF